MKSITRLNFIAITYLLIIFNSSCIHSQDTDSVAIIGVKNAYLSLASSLDLDGPSIEDSTLVYVIEDSGKAVKIRLNNVKSYWVNRIYLCTEKEFANRRKLNQFPDANRITYVGMAEDGQDTMYGYVPIENGSVVIEVGQTLIFNEEYCKAHETKKLEWMGVNTTYKPYNMFLIKSTSTMVELPSWPIDRLK
jgi:hypothetical protein